MFSRALQFADTQLLPVYDGVLLNRHIIFLVNEKSATLVR